VRGPQLTQSKLYSSIGVRGVDKRPVSALPRVQQSSFSVKNERENSASLPYHEDEDQLDLDAVFEDEDNKTGGEWEKWGERGNTPEYDRMGRVKQKSRAVGSSVRHPGQTTPRQPFNGNGGGTWRKVQSQPSYGTTMGGLGRRVREVKLALRGMINERRRSSGKSLATIFNHFDRRNTGIFDAMDLAGAMADLNLPTDAAICKAIIRELAINTSGRDRVTFGEFRVFVEDENMGALWDSWCGALGKGRVSLWMEFSGYNLMQEQGQGQGPGSLPNVDSGSVAEMIGPGDLPAIWGGRRDVGWREFKRGLVLINQACVSAGHGEELDDRDLMRLTKRFDDYGDGVCR
jgi:hypothetical protein